MSNFAFLQDQWPSFYQNALEAEKHANTAPRTCAFYSRFTLEQVVNWMYQNDTDLKQPYEQTLSAMIHEKHFRENLATGLFQRIYYIKKLGNLASHSNSHIKPYEATTALKNLHAFLSWFATTYSKTPPTNVNFDENIIPQVSETDKNAQELQLLQEKLEIQTKELEWSKEELIRIQSDVKNTKEHNKKTLPETNYTESETRTLFIDLLLREAGWDPHGYNVPEYEVVGMPTDKGIGYVDYVLWGDNGLPLGIVEAKRTTENVEKGRRQAELYANCLEQMTGQRPIIFYTNGYETWIWDNKMYPPRQVQGFYTKDELHLLIQRRKTRKDLATVQINKQIVERYYQEEAIRRVTESFSQNHREALLVMATGSGKTRTAVALVEVLMKHNWIKNVLFLADRTALVKQAKDAFKEYLPSETAINLVLEKEDINSRIVFSTYPTMMNCIDDAKNDGQKRFGVGHFDLIIIDEAHRSVYLKYKAIFEYFDSLLIGLTATPKAEIDKNTYHLFNLPDGDPTYAYELSQAVKDGYLVDYKESSVQMKFLRQGLKYSDLSEEEKDDYEVKFGDEETGEVPEYIDPPAFNDWVFNTDTVDKVLSYVMEKGIKINEGDTLGKTIIFAKNHKHAEFIKQRFDINYPQHKGKFLSVIDNKIKYADTLIDEFKEKNEIMIAVSVDMLDTGIDVPEVVNLVFFKIIKSKTKFWQMIGRGTRICKNLFGPGKDKQFFTIFDFCGNLEFFEEYPEGYKPSTQLSLNQRIFKQRLFLSQALQAAEYQENEQTKTLYTQVLDIMHRDISQINKDSFQVRPHRRYLDKFQDRARWDNLSTGDIGEIIEHLIQFTSILDKEDEYARLFDLLILNFQLDTLEPTRKQVRYQEKIIKTAQMLERKANIPVIATHLEIIKKVQQNTFWRDITITRLESIREEIRNLLQYLDRKEKQAVYTEFKDAIQEQTDTNIHISEPQLAYGGYKSRVERIIRENINNSAIYKIRNNIPLTKDDLEEIEEIILRNDPQEDEESLKQTFKDNSLSLFIRQLVGLDKNAAKNAFSQFLDRKNLTADQISFINYVVEFVVARGVMNLDQLYEQPFININSGGLNAIFKPEDAIKIIGIIRDINNNAKYISNL